MRVAQRRCGGPRRVVVPVPATPPRAEAMAAARRRLHSAAPWGLALAAPARSCVFASPVLRFRLLSAAAKGSIHPQTPAGPSAAYDALVEAGQVKDDAAQRAALVYLDNLYQQLVAAPHASPSLPPKPQPAPSKGFLSSWFGSKEAPPPPAPSAPAIRGIYLYGGPGSGKTMLMDLFFNSLPFPERRRIHFHEFMLEVHRTLHDLHRQNITGSAMMESLAHTIRQQAWVLCFDEFQVTDVADAMVLQRLFNLLFASPHNLVMVATSNREPDELYKNGLQRALFVPFIHKLKEQCRIVNMLDSRDYRLLAGERMVGSEGEESSVYIVSNKRNSVKALARFQRLWEQLSKGDEMSSLSLRVQGRTVKVPRAARHTDVARFSFDDLCGQPLGAADYYAIAGTFHTVFLENVPQLSLSEVNQLRRLITLVDTLYDQGTILVVLAQVPIDELFSVDKGAEQRTTEVDVIGDPRYAMSRANVDEVFAFSRTRSRLQEMQTSEYLEKVSMERRSRVSPVRFFSALRPDDGDARQIFDRYDSNDDGVLQMDELQNLLGEFEMFKSGNKHISNMAEIRRELDPKATGNVSWEMFREWMKKELREVTE